MKFSIEKVKNGVKLTLDRPSTKPVEVILTQSEIDVLQGLLNTAKDAEEFKLSMDLPNR